MNHHPDDDFVVAVDDVLEGADWERSRSGSHPRCEVAGVIGEDEVGGDRGDVEEDPGELPDVMSASGGEGDTKKEDIVREVA